MIREAGRRGVRQAVSCQLVWYLGSALTLFGAQLAAQGWGEIAFGYAWQHTDGRTASFASHFGLEKGLFLESLRVDLTPVLDELEKWQLELAGFGGEPWHSGRLRAEWDREWSLAIDYIRRESVFDCANYLAGVRADRWHLTRWSGRLEYRGWKPVIVGMSAHQVVRGGVTA